MDEKTFLAALEKFAPSIQQVFLEAIRTITDDAVLAQLIKAIEAGDAEAAYRAIGYSTSVFNRFVALLTTTFEHGGMMMMASFPKYATDATGMKSVFRFNIRDRAAETWLRDRSSTLVTQIENDVRINVRNTLVAGAEAGRNPRSTALDLVGRYNPQTKQREGGVVGLGQREEYWSRSARIKLEVLDGSYLDMKLRDKRFDSIVIAAIKDGRSLPPETVSRLVDRYRANALRHRGETIGRTETLAALNRSEFESVRQALQQSDLPLAASTKEWDSTGDSAVRPEHRYLDGQRVGIDEPFVTRDGTRMMHPGDITLGATGNDVIACRCRVKYRTDFAYGVK